MAQSIYTGNVSSALGLDYTRNVPLSGGGGAQDYINSVLADIYMSTNAYTNTYNVTVTLKNSSGGVLASSNRAEIKFNAENFGGANWQFGFSTGFDVNAIASFDIIAAANGSKIFVKLGQSVTVAYTVYTACGAPSASINASLAEGDPTLTWSGAYGGAANGITGYEIQYAESANNSTWGDWTALKTVSSGGTGGNTTVTISPTRGYYRKYRIRTQGSAGASYYSGWTETGSCRRNSQPTAHTSFGASPAVYVSGAITLAYSGATDADGNISTHNVQYATSADGVSWGGWVSLANGATSHTPTLSPGHYIKYQVKAVDAFGVASPTWMASNQCGKNTAPGTATVNLPQASKTIYNSRPRILVTLGADPEGHTQTINSEGFTPSQNNVSSAAKIVLRKSDAASAGAVSFAMTTTDQYGESSGEVTRSTTYAAPSFTDAALVGGTTRIKAAHMTELRTMINTARSYYGLSAVVWAEPIVAGATKTRGWAEHIVEMRAAINDILTLVNGWDTASTLNRIPAISWIPLRGRQPQADVIEQVRQVIAWL